MTGQTNEQRISGLEAEVRRIHERINSLARLSQGDVADLKSDIAILRAEMAANHATVVKELAHLGSQIEALPRAIAEPISDLIAAEVGKALRKK